MRGDQVDQIQARISTGGAVAWYMTDRLGSIRDITNSSGGVVDHLDYDGFGNTGSTPSGGDRFLFTGRDYDSEIGLQYNRGRVLRPKRGRWTSQDPFGFLAYDSNLYRYVANQPTHTEDPSGLVRCSLQLPAGADAWKYYALATGAMVAAGATIATGGKPWELFPYMVKMAKAGMFATWKMGEDAVQDMAALMAKMANKRLEPPARDRSGKVHGEIPDHVPNYWTPEELDDAARELERSIRKRKEEQNELGEDPDHRRRLTEEEGLLRKIRKKLTKS